MWFEVIAPLQLVSGTGLIAISTIRKSVNGSQSIYDYLRRLDDPIFKGDKLFKVIHIRTMCDNCIRKGKDYCPHIRAEAASWKDPENAKRVKELMKCNASAMMAEVAGVSMSNGVNVFDATSVARLQKSMPYSCNVSHHGVLFVVIDPSGGGAKSDYAVMTLYYHRGHAVIVGLDTYAGSDEKCVTNMLRNHHAGLRKQPRFANSVMVLLPEGNLNWFTPARIYDQFEAWEVIGNSRRPNVVLYAYNQHKKPIGGRLKDGTFTDHAMKETSTHMVRTLLNNDCIHFDQHIVSQDPVANKEKLIQQLGDFHLEHRDPTDYVTQRTKSYLTGKSKDGAKKDDLAMTLMMGVFWARQCQENDFIRQFVSSRNQQFPQVLIDYKDP
jgi:hypothetical protein